MKAKLFLKEKLENICKKIDGVSIRYEYLSHIHAHIIEITPLSIFNDSNEYMDLEIALEKGFNDLFPKEELVFVSIDSLTKISNPEFQFDAPPVFFNDTYTFYAEEHNDVLVKASELITVVDQNSLVEGELIINALFDTTILEVIGEDNYALAA
jgi:hypothetical protein